MLRWTLFLLELTGRVELRFALSSEMRIDQGFNSAGFYQCLVQYLEHEDQRELTSGLLKWWNRCVSLL